MAVAELPDDVDALKAMIIARALPLDESSVAGQQVTEQRALLERRTSDLEVVNKRPTSGLRR